MNRYSVWGRDESGAEFLEACETRIQMLAIVTRFMNDWEVIEYEWITEIGYPETNTVAINGKLV